MKLPDWRSFWKSSEDPGTVKVSSKAFSSLSLPVSLSLLSFSLLTFLANRRMEISELFTETDTLFRLQQGSRILYDSSKCL